MRPNEHESDPTTRMPSARKSDEPSTSQMEHSEPTNAELSSSHPQLNDSFSCFEDEDDADILLSTDASSNEDETEVTSLSRRRLVRPLVVALILGVGAVVSVTAFTVTKRDDQRLCEDAAIEASANMQTYAEESLRTEVDTLTFDTSVDNCDSSWPAVLSVILAVCFLMAAVGFVWYDRRQQGKYEKAQKLAERTTSLVASLYPKQVRDRLLQEQAPNASESAKANKRTIPHGSDDEATLHTKNSVADEVMSNRSGHSRTQPGKKAAIERTEPTVKDIDETGALFISRPIADHFQRLACSLPIWQALQRGRRLGSRRKCKNEIVISRHQLVSSSHTSVLISSRFMLLETLYGNFDLIAKKYGIFKVETIGDCYVAASGIPDFRKDHATSMCRFARDCLAKTKELVKTLETTLGPDTADLQMRIGIHSGPVTGGVLRGEKSRFQLFGDSMNTAARIETTGAKGRIHLSQSTADALLAMGKEKWFYARDEKVYAKGKGELQTYWLKVGKKHPEKTKKTSKSRLPSGSKLKEVREDDEGSVTSWSDSDYDSDDSNGDFDSEELLSGLVSEKTSRLIDWNVDNLQRLLKEVVACRTSRGMPQSPYVAHPISAFTIPLDEVVESIEFEPMPRKLTPAELALVKLDRDVVTQLHDFVTNIAIMYKDNDYNNFERASQMLLAVTKSIARVDELSDTGRFSKDPLAVFAAAFSALVHDVDHPGVPNEIFAKENEKMNKLFKGTSMAEQNSFDLAFGLLMDDTYAALRAALFSSQNDVTRFRHMVVNFVLATDVSDKTLRACRDARWAQSLLKAADSSYDLNYKATLVCELMVQAADVVHTMQHWEVYTKWSERLFAEHHAAFVQKRVCTNPAEYWYAGELDFFDRIVIPLAEKLSTCGVFGSFGSECLSYAVNNRQEWQDSGRQLVEQMAKAQSQATIKVPPPPVATKRTSVAPQPVVPVQLSVDKKLSDVAKKTTNDNLGAAMNPLMSKMNALQQMEERMASGSDNNSASAESVARPRGCSQVDKNLNSIAKRAASSNLGSAMNMLMNQVNSVQQMEKQIASASSHGRHFNSSHSGVRTTDDYESTSSEESFSMESSVGDD